MSSEDAEFVCSETTSVFHLAAIYDLAVAKDTAQKVNLEGTQNVKRICKKHKDLRRYKLCLPSLAFTDISRNIL
jgi:nucleoside-diphosphate-sugar epimerase